MDNIEPTETAKPKSTKSYGMFMSGCFVSQAVTIVLIIFIITRFKTGNIYSAGIADVDTVMILFGVVIAGLWTILALVTFGLAVFIELPPRGTVVFYDWIRGAIYGMIFLALIIELILLAEAAS